MFFVICFGSLFSWLQAPLQAFLRPALWIPGLRALHRCKEKWQLTGNVEVNFKKIVDSVTTIMVRQMDDEHVRRIKISKVNEETKFLQVFYLTRFMQWLDVVEIEVLPGEEGTLVKVHSFSSGFLPICLPLAFLVNMVLFFIPFWDWKQNKKRLALIRETVGIESDVELASNC